MRPPQPAGRPAALVLAFVLISLSGCTSGSSDDTTTAGSDGGANAAEAGRSGDASGKDVGTGARTSARVLPSEAVIYTGRITVAVKDVSAAAARAEDVALTAGGEVAEEEASTDPRFPGRGQVRIRLRVPPDEFRETLTRLGRLGTELHRTRTRQNVTQKVVDVDSRLRTQARSVTRVRQLLDDATSIQDVVALESELARRESDLESLQAQLDRLADDIEMATIEALLVPDRTAAGREREADDLGFLTGVQGGWKAFTSMVLLAVTVLGAALPFAALAAAAGWAYLTVRRRLRSAGVQPADSA